MSRSEKNKQKQENKIILKIFIVAVFLIAVLTVLKYAQNYLRDDIVGKTNLIINNNNVTNDLNKDIFVENGVTYIAKEDIYNFFDPYIYYDEKYNQIITGSESQIASIVVGEKQMTNNGSNVSIPATIIEKDGTYYIPFSALDSVYNVKTTYIESSNIVVIDSLNRKLEVADSNKDNQVKYKPTGISRTVDKVKRGENVTLVNDSSKDGWIKIRTDSGKLGYVKEDSITNKLTIRNNMVTSEKIDGNVSMVWDYIYEYADAPSRSGKIKGINVVSPTFFTLTKLGKGEVHENVGDSGNAYIEWAHSNGYKVWPSISNSAMIETTSEIMNDYKLRQKLIDKIVSLVVKYNLDGINIDFENMYEADKKMFSRFIIELKPRLNEIGAVLSVDVTAPDGGETWSMCYDRHTIGKVADYIVFMAYDQYGSSSAKEGTTAGYDWVEVNLKKMVGTQEEIDSKKIVLGIPFYTRVWEESNGGADSSTIDMKSINSVVPSNAKKTWDDDLKQYIVEYTKDGKKYKIWVEDEKSIEAKLSLIEKYNLAGAAYWKKDGETSAVLDLISEKLNIK